MKILAIRMANHPLYHTLPPILTSNHHPKILTEICMQVGSESLPIRFLDLTHSNNPKAPQNEKQTNNKPSSLDR